MITKDLISQFDECLKKNCRFIYEYYNDPVSSEQVEKFLRKYGLNISDKSDFKAIYEWKNGIDKEMTAYDVDLRITDAGNFLSLNDIELLSEANAKRKSGWRPLSLIPIMANFEGEYFLIETDISSPEFNYVYFFSPNFSFSIDPVTCFDNLEMMLRTIIEIFNRGAQKYNDEENKMEFDFELISEIARNINPLSEQWKEE